MSADLQPIRAITRKAPGVRTDVTNTGAGTFQGERSSGNIYLEQPSDLPGSRKRLFVPPQIQTTTVNVPDVGLMRGGIQNNPIDGGSIRRQKIDIGGNTPGQLATLRGTELGGRQNPPLFGQFAPDMSTYVAGPNNAPMIAGFGPFPDRDFYTRDITPIGPRADPQNISWNNMPAKPTYFDSQMPPPSENGRLAGTASNQQFIDMNGRVVTQVGGVNPFANIPWQLAADQVSNTNDTGDVNARVKYTFTLSETAQQFAHTQESYFPLIGEMEHQDVPTETQLAFGMFASPMVKSRVWDLVVANWLMATEQITPRSYTEVMDVSYFANKYPFLGTVASEQGAKKTTLGSRQETTTLRLVVACLGGDSYNCYNYWGNPGYGAELGFILKGIPISEIYAYNHYDVGSYNLDPTTECGCETFLQRGIMAKNIIQYVPWAAKHIRDRRPTLAELEYKDHFGQLRTGVFVPFGTFYQLHDGLGNAEMIARAPFSKFASMKAGSIALLVSRKGVHY